jgi:CRISPR/Cas system-associated protein Cas7 (RAMP superfamily)
VGMETSSFIMDKISKINPLFKDSDLRCYFHYTLKEDGFNKDNIHKDFDVDYAGVLYLTPNPSTNSGTAFYDDLGNETDYVENIYNRFVFYPSNEWHSLKESFGDNINNGRLTFTIFCKLKKKETLTFI